MLLFLYLLSRPAGRGEMRACVVAAETTNDAREVAAENAHDEGSAAWRGNSRCQRLGTADALQRALVLADVIEG